MRKEQILCSYYPTTAVLVDDSSSFLENIVLQLDSYLPVKICDNPKSALNYLEKKKLNTGIISNVIEPDLDNPPEFGKYSINYTISNLHQAIYNPTRFDEVSVVIVDYVMPGMNGIEFFENLRHLPVKKVMLTGEANDDLAIQALNEGVIDKFIRKGQPKLGGILNQTIYELQKAYFKDFSNLIIKALSFETTSCFNEPNYCSLWHQTFKEAGATDYYLIDTSGSFLFVSSDGTPTWLLVKSQEELRGYLDQAEDGGESHCIISALETGEKLPYFSNFEDYMCAINGVWGKYLHNATLCKGERNYFYSIVKQLPYFGLKTNKIFSLKNHISDANRALSLAV